MSRPFGLTVRELREELAQLPSEMDDVLVVLSRDPEGNGFDTACHLQVGWYEGQYRGEFVGSSPVDNEEWRDAMNRVTQSMRDEDEEPLDPSDPPIDMNPAVCIWP